MERVRTQLEQVLRGSLAPADGLVARLLLLTLVCGGLYGATMGTFGLFAGDRLGQVVISATKVPLLLLATFAISLPSFFVLNTLLGVRGDFPVVLRSLVSSQAGLTIVLAALAPYVLVWYASFTDYNRAILFNGVMFAIATFTAQGLLRRAYRALIASNPRHRWLLATWVVLYSFVGIQMAWVLRPFVGQPGTPLQFFRDDTWGNAYLIVGKTIWDVLTR